MTAASCSRGPTRRSSPKVACTPTSTRPSSPSAAPDAAPRMSAMDLGLDGRVYIVTGGSGGLGRATAEALVADGARVVLSGRHQDTVDAAARELGAEVAVGVVADNADSATPARLVEQARSSYGRLDGALISVGGPPSGALLETTDEQWEAAVGSAFMGALRAGRDTR